ncbi:hypothetical protein E4T66_14285 [Sinimarinibacterium sp. CAU 1509]|uniref:hypothetical protein n=1 Tax=Sinimarinibacterium sp. CAU 1509 TaxID=2562283 RepID=UPI0010ACCCA8|nr:hypothetical protein [Sinimarinibacterium sp. CAU 1509]TJY58770.1 hypothetical protein E4T66_14285 [Sinimarinibacterium sp. CAU 1509]
MTKDEIRRAFADFAGDERFGKFCCTTQWVSLNEFRTRAWQELLMEKFQETHSDLSTTDILAAVTDETRFIYACPTLGCSYIAACEDIYPINFESAAWSCGECAIRWASTIELFNEIRAAIARFPYRAACYEEDASGYIPAPRSSWPKDYEERVSAEFGA